MNTGFVKLKTPLIFLLGIILLFTMFLASVSIGSVKIPPKEIIKMLSLEANDNAIEYKRDEFSKIVLEDAKSVTINHKKYGTKDIDPDNFENIDLKDKGITSVTVTYQLIDETHEDIVKSIRLPRALAAILGGAALAVAGLLLQIFFRNPIVDPFVLGISSGSTFITALFILAGLQLGVLGATPLGRFFAAFLGAFAVMAVMLLFALKVRSATTLLIIGLMVGYFCSAGTGFLMTFAEKEAVKGFVVYSLGSFSGFMWKEVGILAIVSLTFLFGAFLTGKQLNAFLLGENYAKSLGINLKLFRVIIILISSILTAVVTAFAGPIAFIGLAVPHIVRMLYKTSDSRILVPGCIIYGALITAVCDLLARMVFSPQELALSTVTSIFGVPIVIRLILKRRAR